MKTLIRFSLLFSLFSAMPMAHAHDGDHEAPGLVEAPKGGEIKAIENAYVEVLARGSSIQIYLYEKNLKPLNDTKNVTIAAETLLPRSKTPQPLTFERKLDQKNGSFSTNFDAKGSHRYTLIVKIKDGRPHTGPGAGPDASSVHEDKLTFTIEPRQ